MADYRIAIPSHRRASLFASTTLSYLQSTNVDMHRVTVFVSDQIDADEYMQLPLELDIVVAGTPDLTSKFNFIEDYYDYGEQVVVIEDDITVIGMDGEPVVDLVGLFIRGFEHIPHGGLWGIAPHSNTYFMSEKVSTTLKLVVAHMFGFVSTHDPMLKTQCAVKTDYERTIRYFERYGFVVRLDMYGVKTKSYTQDGGLQSQLGRIDRKRLEEESVAWLVSRWPHLIGRNEKKTSMFPELSFKRLKAAK